MPRFALLAHDHPFAHWDLMLEENGILRTWRLHEVPVANNPVRAESIGDHRLEYLDYEGPIANARGAVAQVDSGSFEWNINSAKRVVIRVNGQRMNGTLELVETQIGWNCSLT